MARLDSTGKVPRVASNDPGLAHGVARAGIGALADKSKALYERLLRKTVPEVSRILKRHFGELVLLEDIARVHGRGANALWLVLDADESGEELQPLRVVVRYARGYGGLMVGEYRLRITAHCVARLLQRSAHVGNIRATGPMLLDHLVQASDLIETGQVLPRDDVETNSAEGSLRWTAKRRAGKTILIAKTWIAVGMMSDQQQRDCRQYVPVIRRERARARHHAPAT